jgi:alpha-1,2-mannosyltransferase
MVSSGSRRLLLLIAAGVVMYAAVSFQFLTGLVGSHAPRMIDLAVYRWGGGLAAHGTQLYRVRFDGLRFTYPPAAAMAFIPVSALSLRDLGQLSVATGVLAIIATVWISFGSLGWKRHGDRVALTLVVSAAAMCLEPVRQTFKFGQVNLILLAIVVADLCLPDTSRWKGIGVGLAAGFKLTPLIFVPYLFLTRRVSAGFRAVAAFGGTIALGFLVIPAESSQFWFGHLFADPRRVGGLDYVANQSLDGLLVRHLGGSGAAHWPWLAGSCVIFAIGIAGAVRLSRRGLELAGIVLCGLTGLLISPVSWSHHWVWVIPALVLAIDAALRRSRLMWLAVAAILVGFQGTHHHGWIWYLPATHNREMAWTASQWPAGNLYVLIGLAVTLVVATWLAFDSRAATRPRAPVSHRAPRPHASSAP